MEYIRARSMLCEYKYCLKYLTQFLQTNWWHRYTTTLQIIHIHIHIYTYKKDNSYLHNLLHIKDSLFKVLCNLENYISKLYLWIFNEEMKEKKEIDSGILYTHTHTHT